MFLKYVLSATDFSRHFRYISKENRKKITAMVGYIIFKETDSM